jgi:para-nitrobenzyl esterase
MSFVAIALAAFLAQPAPAPAAPHGGHAGHAPAAAPAPRLSSATTTIGDLMANPAAKAVVDKHLPGFSAHPQIAMAASLTLRAVQQFTQGQITDAHLTAIDAELAALPAS